VWTELKCESGKGIQNCSNGITMVAVGDNGEYKRGITQKKLKEIEY
jgi:hypothetical protein